MLAAEAGLWQALLIVAVGGAVTSALAWLVGTQITYRWDELKRQRESDLKAADEFYSAYGQFFSTWKLWNTQKDHSAIALPDRVEWALLEKAEESEARFEALLVKLASERVLAKSDTDLLACFRQAYQALREHMREGRALRWWASGDPSDPGVEYREYRAFKALSEFFANLLARDESPRWPRAHRERPSQDQAIQAFIECTVVRSDWCALAEERLLRSEHRRN
jgi:hypothetical protein